MSLVIVKVSDLITEAMHDDLGNILEDIEGMQAANGQVEGIEQHAISFHKMGLDIITMQPYTQFPLHTHPGYHILYILDGPIVVHYDGVDYYLAQGDSVFVPARDPHGVKTVSYNRHSVKFLAIGYPHEHVSSSERMTITEGENRSTKLQPQTDRTPIILNWTMTIPSLILKKLMAVREIGWSNYGRST